MLRNRTVVTRQISVTVRKILQLPLERKEAASSAALADRFDIDEERLRWYLSCVFTVKIFQ